MKSTIVTALFDIGRAKIDGRSINQYYEWFKQTLQIQCPMQIYSESKHTKFILDNRPKHLETKIVIQELSELPYFHLKNKIDEILVSVDYKKKIADPSRIECKNSLYSIIQFSKFSWVFNAAQENYFGSDYFFWLDAGISRFIADLNISYAKFPGAKITSLIKKHPEKTLIQTFRRPYRDLSAKRRKIPHDYLYDNRSYVLGGIFGSDSSAIDTLTKRVDSLLEHDMINRNIINNEQIALGYLLKLHSKDFLVFENNNRIHRNSELLYRCFE
jgi:hypothetical protein